MNHPYMLLCVYSLNTMYVLIGHQGTSDSFYCEDDYHKDEPSLWSNALKNSYGFASGSVTGSTTAYVMR